MQCEPLHQPMEVGWVGSDISLQSTLPGPLRHTTTFQNPVRLVTHWPNTWPRPVTTSDSGRQSLQSGEAFPFQLLPEEVRVNIFKYLKPTEKAVGRRVCKDWKSLLSHSALWQHINFSCVPLCLNTRPHHRCSQLCYSKYCKRVKEFVDFLSLLSTKSTLFLLSLQFSFDIREPGVEWRRMIQRLITACETSKLTFADINWKDTYFRQLWRGYEPPNDQHYWHRLRQRIFLAFFEAFVHRCQHLRTLLMPFEWSDKSIDLLSNLHKLDTLVLHRYFDFSAPGQESVQRLLSALPGLLRLMLEIWCYSEQGYSLQHSNLQYLDVTQCRGLNIQRLDMPKLLCFKITRSRWSGVSGILGDTQVHRCLFSVLREGARSLQQLNELTLARGWYRSNKPYSALDQLLANICSCPRHFQN